MYVVGQRSLSILPVYALIKDFAGPLQWPSPRLPPGVTGVSLPLDRRSGNRNTLQANLSAGLGRAQCLRGPCGGECYDYNPAE
jgi:hypothetical protein